MDGLYVGGCIKSKYTYKGKNVFSMGTIFKGDRGPLKKNKIKIKQVGRQIIKVKLLLSHVPNLPFQEIKRKF